MTGLSARELTGEESSDQDGKSDESPAESTVDAQRDDPRNGQMNGQNPWPRKPAHAGSPEAEGQVQDKDQGSDRPQSHAKDGEGE